MATRYLFRVEYTAACGMSQTQGCIEYVWAKNEAEAKEKVRASAPERVQRIIYESRLEPSYPAWPFEPPY